MLSYFITVFSALTLLFIYVILFSITSTSIPVSDTRYHKSLSFHFRRSAKFRASFFYISTKYIYIYVSFLYPFFSLFSFPRRNFVIKVVNFLSLNQFVTCTFSAILLLRTFYFIFSNCIKNVRYVTLSCTIYYLVKLQNIYLIYLLLELF